jgi:uncharacterized membrane protein HdeD (DUF308 family)
MSGGYMVATIKDTVEELWWLYILQGLVTIIFGVVALFAPAMTLYALIITVAVYAIVIGLVELVHGFSSIGKTQSWWFSLLLGFLIVGLGVYLIRHPDLNLGLFIVFVGTFLLIRGVFDIIAAAFFSGKSDNRWLLAISGALGIIAGIYVWSNPVAGGLAFVWILGLYALITGSMTISYALHIKGMFDDLKDRVEGAMTKPGHSGRIAHR